MLVLLAILGHALPIIWATASKIPINSLRYCPISTPHPSCNFLAATRLPRNQPSLLEKALHIFIFKEREKICHELSERILSQTPWNVFTWSSIENPSMATAYSICPKKIEEIEKEKTKSKEKDYTKLHHNTSQQLSKKLINFGDTLRRASKEPVITCYSKRNSSMPWRKPKIGT